MKRFILLLAMSLPAFAQSSVFPGAVDTDTQLGVAADHIQTTLTAPIGTTDTTIYLANTTNMPVNGILTLGGPGGEQVQVCAVTTGSVTVGHSSCPNVDGRGFAGTTASAYSTGTFTSMNVNAYYQKALASSVKAIENAIGSNLSHLPGGTVTSLASGCGLTGGPITTTGTLKSNQTAFFVSASSYNFASNCGQLVVRTNSTPSSDTLPQAGTGSYPAGAWLDVQNNGPNPETITPTSSTINGQASITLTAGQGAHIISDNTGWWAQITGAGTGTVSSVASGCGLAGGPITGSGTLASSEAVNGQSGSSYTFLTGDCGKLVNRTRSGVMTDTLPQAGGSFPAGWWLDVQNNGTGTETITVTSSTINGQSTLALAPTQGAHIVSDGSNYQAQVASANALGLPAGNQGQTLQIQPNTGNSSTLQFVSPVTLNASTFNFSAQSPGTSLSAGSNTITLNPCPLGVIGTAPNMQLYISGGSGSGSNEVVPVTGGTCAGDGISSGTVVVTVAACGGGTCHSGGWTISSSAAGILEAINQLPAAGGAVELPAGTVLLYGPAIITKDNVNLKGQPSSAINGGLCHPENGGLYCDGPSTIQAAGTWPAGSYMFTWNGFNNPNGHQWLLGGGARDLTLDAHNLAAGEISITAYTGMSFANLHLTDHTNASGNSYGLFLKSTNNQSLTPEPVCGYNGGAANFDHIFIESFRVGAGGIQVGVPGTTYDVCSNRFNGIDVNTYGAPGLYGIWVAQSDSNFWSNVYSQPFGGYVTVQSITTDSSTPPVATIHATAHGIPLASTGVGIFLNGAVNNSGGSCPGSGEFAGLQGPHIVSVVDANTLTITSAVAGLGTATSYCVSGSMRAVGMLLGDHQTQGNMFSNYMGSVAVSSSSNLNPNQIVNWNWATDDAGNDQNYARYATLGAPLSILNGRYGVFASPMLAAPYNMASSNTPFIDLSKIFNNGTGSSSFNIKLSNNSTIQAPQFSNAANSVVVLTKDSSDNVNLGSVFGSGANTTMSAPAGNFLLFNIGSQVAQLDNGGNWSSVGYIKSGAKTFATLPTCNGGREGSVEAVTDSNTNAWGALIAGGGTFHVQGYCNGTNWYVNATNVNGGSGSMVFPTSANTLAVNAGGGAWNNSLNISATAPVFNGIVKGGATAGGFGGGFIVPNNVYYQGTTSGGTPKNLLGISTTDRTVLASNNDFGFSDSSGTVVLTISPGTQGALFNGPMTSNLQGQVNKAGAVTFGTLPACAGAEGSFAAISDSTVNAGGAVISGGGSFHVLGYCNGTSWTVTGSVVQLGAVASKTANYTVTNADFANYATIYVPSGTPFTLTLTSSGTQPLNGQSINVVNVSGGALTIARNGQNINGAASNLTLGAASASAPTFATIWSDGTNYEATVGGSGGGGGGAAATYQLTDLNVTRTSSTVLTIGSGCGSTTPCNVRFNGTTYSFTASATATISGGSDTGYVYITNDGVLHVGTVTAGNVTCAGCTTTGSISAFPANTLPIWTWTSGGGGAGTWDTTGGSDKRSFQSARVATAGTGIVITPGATSDTVAIDTAVVAMNPPTSTGTSVTLAGPKQYFICTGVCAVTVPVPAAGYEFCVYQDDNTSGAITLSALGSSARYENTARTAYGTAGTGTLVSAGAVKEFVCILGRDATHYLTTSSSGTWTAN